MNQRVVGSKFSWGICNTTLVSQIWIVVVHSKMLQMIPLTRSRVEIICAWTDCQQLVEINKKGGYRQDLKVPWLDEFRDFRLLRVINNTLYNDWPWEMERFEDSLPSLRENSSTTICFFRWFKRFIRFEG